MPTGGGGACSRLPPPGQPATAFLHRLPLWQIRSSYHWPPASWISCLLGLLLLKGLVGRPLQHPRARACACVYDNREREGLCNRCGQEGLGRRRGAVGREVAITDGRGGRSWIVETADTACGGKELQSWVKSCQVRALPDLPVRPLLPRRTFQDLECVYE